MDKLTRLGRLSLDEEAVFFGVSTMTIRRDIAMFESMGVAVRSQGGAVSRMADPTQQLLGGASSEAQVRIARKALDYIPEGCTLMLSTGRTTLEVARQLAVSGRRLAVVTNSLQVAAALFQTQAQVILTGGTLRADSLDLVGPVAEKNLDEYYIDVLITGCDGASGGEGFFTKDLNLAAMERKSVDKSRRVIVVTESAKFRHPSVVKFAETARVGLVITDQDLQQADETLLSKVGVEIVKV